MHEQHALHAAGDNKATDRLEVLARLLVVPHRAAWRQWLQPQRRPGRMARDAACVARALGEEDRLHLRLEHLEIERSCRRRLARPRAKEQREHDGYLQHETSCSPAARLKGSRSFVKGSRSS